MIDEQVLKSELKKYPKFIRKAIKEGDLVQALTYKIEMETLDWILNDNWE